MSRKLPYQTAPRNAGEKLAFFVYSRKAPASLVAFSILASCIGGTATLAMIDLARTAGWPSIWWLASGALGLVVLGLGFAEKIRETSAATLPEIIALFENAACRKAAGCIALLSGIAIVAA